VAKLLQRMRLFAGADIDFLRGARQHAIAFAMGALAGL
jgi:hypothetical protein